MATTHRHNRLVQKLSTEIHQLGPIPFARFMELALYDQEDGYYTVLPSRDQQGNSGSSRIGWEGDFYTAPWLSPILAKSLVRQISEVDACLGRPNVFTLLEMGPGDGKLAHDFLADCAEQAGDLYGRLRYILIERSPAMVAKQQTHLANLVNHGASVSWVSSLESLKTGTFEGAFISNELVDAFPVHRVRKEHGDLRELYVDYDGGRFIERFGEPSTPALESALTSLGAHLPEGFSTEINVQALQWMKDVAQVLKKGVVLTIDYGHTAHDYFAPTRNSGTFLCYSRHRVAMDPYEELGDRDMTAHVNFTSLAITGQEAGLSVTGFTNLMNFLMGLGSEEMMAGMDPESPGFRSVAQFLRPDGLGGTFKILVQHKGMDRPTLSGLKYRPFFEDALMDPAGVGRNSRHLWR